jgi:hypothetical protein
MNVLFPALAVAFSAFCVWLAVRIVNRRERWAKWTGVGLIVVLTPLCAYVSAYEYMVFPGGVIIKGPRGIPRDVAMPPVYRANLPVIGDVFRDREARQQFFSPIHCLDRQLRPDKWTIRVK